MLLPSTRIILKLDHKKLKQNPKGLSYYFYFSKRNVGTKQYHFLDFSFIFHPNLHLLIVQTIYIILWLSLKSVCLKWDNFMKAISLIKTTFCHKVFFFRKNVQKQIQPFPRLAFCVCSFWTKSPAAYHTNITHN